MPILSGFLPIPLAMMIPFMGAQSLVLGKAFGEGFQYGKRKISSLTNEEFNKLTPSDIAANSRRELQQMIPEMKASITDMRDFQSFIVHELIATAKQLPDDIFSGITGQGKGTPAGDAFDLTLDAFGLPKAFADDTDTDKTQKFASDYEKEAYNLGFTLLLRIVKTFGTRSDIPIEKRVGYLNAFKRLQAIEDAKVTVKDTTDESIAKTTTAGSDVQKIATLFNEIKLMLATYAAFQKKLRAAGLSSLKRRQLQANANVYSKRFRLLVSQYNQFVQSIRKPNLSINETKSLSTLRIST